MHELDPWEEPSEGGPRAIIFTLANDTLSLNTTGISTGGGGSSTRVWELLFSGNWAAFGTIDSSGSLVPDLYATFLYDGHGGRVQWARNTPFGYTAPLMLGSSFIGDGAATYYDYSYSEPTGRSTRGTLVLWSSLARRPLEDDTYTARSHTFYVVSNIPEPSSVLALFCGLVCLAGAALRRKMRTPFRKPT